VKLNLQLDKLSITNYSIMYKHVARSCPPKDQPWYHVLVNNAVHQTYVAERNLACSEEQQQPIHHPLLNHYFKGMEKGCYQLKTQNN